MRRLPLLLAGLLASALAGCQGAGEGGGGRFSGFYLGASGGLARDADGRRVDLDATSTAPAIPSASTVGFGR